ncbi:MAG TPA: hypothetical protein PKE49_13110 [Leptospiraceae bacterium]|jgi:lipoprotein LenA|nr:hypothetical protein [Leptospirales bacterium]HMU83552.1 hypothetical protein [Leptospiraceae bacterium]HMX57458.1 hypothetical protein [Leptospiraceae bacterium]HMY44408.1 hypothetical protein [Leptospiraceae bacterium]HMZ35056.1 hypothetical protein [Leptospiraceae bacterium]
MKPFVLFLAALTLFTAECKQGGKISQSTETRVTRFRMGVLKTMGDPKSALPLSLEKGEVVTLDRIESYKPAQGAAVEYAKIKIAGGQEGYVVASYLAKSGVVITGDAKLYQRPNITSGLARGNSNLTVGTVAFVENEEFSDGEWVEVSGGANSASYFRGWLKGGAGISKDTELVTAAVRFEQAAEIYKNPKASSKTKEEATATLKDLASSAPAPINQLARELASGDLPPDNPPVEPKRDEGIQPLEQPSTTPQSN